MKSLKEAQECLGVHEITFRYALQNNKPFLFNPNKKKIIFHI